MRAVAVIRGPMAAAVILTAAAHSSAQPSPTRLLDVPFIEQSEALCGGAAAAMVMRYWGATAVYAESFAPLVDKAAGGIKADRLVEDLRRRDWAVTSFRGDFLVVAARLNDGQPVIALIEDRPSAFHFVVIVGWANGRVVYHDPARAPFRVIAEKAFEAAWEKSGRWTMLALPPAKGINPAATDERTPAVPAHDRRSGCDALIASGVRAATEGDKSAALSVFSSAADLCPQSAAPLREAAGVYALDGRWTEAAQHAREAIARDRHDDHSWRILATSAYVQGDLIGALSAWNAVGEPLVDLVTVKGLERTRHAVTTGLMRVRRDAPLTARVLEAAGRRLDELPAAEITRVSYVPIGNGRANVEAVVLERPRLPTSRGSLLTGGLHAVVDRELVLTTGSLTGSGESLSANWRWWDERPRLALGYAIPTRAGVWSAEVFGEKQSYVTPSGVTRESRRGGSLALSNWTSDGLRWEFRVGADGWSGDSRSASVGVAVTRRLFADGVSVRASASALAGTFSAHGWSADAEWRSRRRHEGVVILASGGATGVSGDSPLALWPGAGTGHARTALLRAHPLIDHGRIAGDVFGRRLGYASVESRYWLKPVKRVVRIAPAVFVDVARAEQRLFAQPAWHVDIGAGVRIALLGKSVLRADVGKGLRDGSTAFSAAIVK